MVKGKRGLGVYGTGRADQLNGKDNTLRIKRVALPMIEEELQLAKQETGANIGY